MNRRVMIVSKVKQEMRSRSESESEKGEKLDVIDPKPSDLAMTRLKLG